MAIVGPLILNTSADYLSGIFGLADASTASMGLERSLRL